MPKIDLNGTWKIYSVDRKFEFNGTVPGSFFYELEKSGYWGKDSDVFFRENNRECVDLASRDFVFERHFDLPTGWQNPENRVFLKADGLDTLTRIQLNSDLVAETQNMHQSYNLDITSKLRAGDNHIAITFLDAIKEINRRHAKRPLWTVKTPLVGGNQIRKNFCSFGWDWGPQIPDIGIFRDISVVSYKGARITDFHVTQKHHDGRVTLNISNKVEQWQKLGHKLSVKIEDPDGKLSTSTFDLNSNLVIDIDRPQLWWPNGYGAQPLYKVTCDLSCENEVIDSRRQYIGLRQLKMERLPDEWGTSFHFSINGIAIFAKGANYIPEDVYLARVTPEKTARLLDECILANFNCIRVWGGGIYPADHFFDLCDRKGIIVWQDLMFACAIYDIHNPEFYRSIAAEAEDNLKRIRHHASLGLICGNNEMEWAFEEWGFNPTKENRAEYLKQYEVLFPEIVQRICPYIDYWPASPSSGGYFEKPNSCDAGDVHDWSVWHGRNPFTNYRKNYYRFLSEFGFQSFPSYKTIKTFTLPEDRNIFSPVMEDHQRNEGDNGNNKILHYIGEYFRYPKDFEQLIYVSQLSQAEAVRYAVEHLRQNRGRCMGATYWQLNDIWPGASWSSIDHFGRWKALHYITKRIYAPLLLSIREEERSADIYITNDTLQAVTGSLSWQLLKMDGSQLRRGQQAITVKPLSADKVAFVDFTDVLNTSQSRHHYLSVSFCDEHKSEWRATATFVRYKYLDLQDPKVSLTIREVNDQFLITATAQSFAKGVELDFDHHDRVFSDNYFDLDAGEQRLISTDKGGLSLVEFKNALKSRSLFDTF